MKSLKKALAVILAILMIASLSPAAFAQDGQTTDDSATEDTSPEVTWSTAFGVIKGEGTLAQAIAASAKGDRINLLKDITLAEGIEITKNTTINGNGYTVTRDAEFKGVLITVSSQATLTLTSATLDGNTDNVQGSSEQLIAVTSGALTLGSGASLVNNYAAYSLGSAVALGSDAGEQCTMTMLDGSTIANCTAQNGGAIAVGANSTLYVTGGTISGCKAAENGGAVYLSSATAKAEITGGTITENEASLAVTTGSGSAVSAPSGTLLINDVTVSGNVNEANLGAVYIGASADATLGGDIVIASNSGGAGESNIYLAQGAGFKVEPALSQNAKLSVTPENGFADGANLDFIEYDGEVTGYLYYDLTGETFFISNDNVVLMDCVTVTFDPGNGTCSVAQKIYAVDVDFGTLPVPDEREGFEFLGWYTANDVLITETSPVSFSEDFTLYAKWENLNELDMSPLAVIGRFFQRIGELMRTVFEFLQNLFMGGGDKDLDYIK